MHNASCLLLGENNLVCLLVIISTCLVMLGCIPYSGFNTALTGFLLVIISPITQLLMSVSDTRVSSDIK